MKDKIKSRVSLIGGADGPTSIYIAGRSGKRPLKVRIHNYIYKWKSDRVKKRIVVGAHTLEALVKYAKDKYGAVEVDMKHWKYAEQRKNLKESLLLRHKPEVLEEFMEIPRPDFTNEDSIREYFQQLEARSEMIAEIPDSEIPMDFHVYEIKIGENCLEMEIDYRWNVFGISWSGNKKAMKQLKKISQELYLYYGVSEEDIREKTERYSALLAALSS